MIKPLQPQTLGLSRGGRTLNRSNIWNAMKRLCKSAQVGPEKVYPHNLRHLFARTFYKKEKDISRLADILGHENVNTTRIYVVSSGGTKAQQALQMQRELGKQERKENRKKKSEEEKARRFATPNAKTCAKRDYQSLQYVNCAVEKIHINLAFCR